MTHIKFIDGSVNFIEDKEIFNDPGDNPTDNIYTDRLTYWDRKKYDRLVKKHFDDCGDYWYNRTCEQIEAFLSDWFKQDIILVSKEEFINQQNGYPYWQLVFYERK